MFGSLLGAGISAVGGIFAAHKANKAQKRADRLTQEAVDSLGEQRSKNQAWYDRRYNEDPTQRADAVAWLTRAQNDIRNRNRQAAGAQAVSGGTDESVAAAKAANNEALSQTVGNIVAQGEARKDNIERQYLQRDDAYESQYEALKTGQAQRYDNKAQQNAAAGSQAVATGANILANLL